MKRFHLSRKKQASNDNQFFWAVVGLATVTSMLLCLWIGMRQSIWFDEAYSILVAKQSIADIFHLVSLDTHPPAYYLLLHGWGWLFGWSEFALRSLSVLAYGGSIAVAGLLVRRMFGARAAVAALMFLILAPLLMRYGFEIRMYSLASLIGIGSTYVMVAAREQKDKKTMRWLWAAYAVLVALGMMTLYYMAFLFIAHALWLLVMSVKNSKQLKLKHMPWLYAYGGAIILFLPWLPTFLSQLTNNALAPIGQSMNIENLIGVVSFNFIYQPVWQLTMAMSIIVLVIIASLFITLPRAWRLSEHREYLALLIMYIGVPIALLMLVSLLRPMYVERYLSHVAIGFMLLVGVSIWLAEQHRPSRVVKTMAGILMVVLLIGFMHLASVGNYNYQRLQKPNLEQVARELASCKDGDAIVAADPYVAIELMSQLPTCAVHFYSDTADLKGGYAPLANSVYRVNSPVSNVSGNGVIKYVYYGEPKLQFSETYHANSWQQFGPMTVTTLSEE